MVNRRKIDWLNEPILDLEYENRDKEKIKSLISLWITKTEDEILDVCQLSSYFTEVVATTKNHCFNIP